MKVSVVISSYWVDDEKPSILQRCIKSLVGYDELLTLVTTKESPLGFADSWNRISSIAKGDYIMFVGDNNYQTAGNLRELCIPNTVTSPTICHQKQDFWGMVFCMPRDLVLKFGPYDMIYNNGSHFEDTDLALRLEKSGISCVCVDSVNFDRPSGGRTIEADVNFMKKRGINAEIFRQTWHTKQQSV